MTKKRVVIAGVIVVDVLMLVGLLILVFRNAAKTAVIDVLLTPMNATISINGESHGQGTYKTYPGKTTAVISADGFQKKTVELDLSPEDTTKIYEYLIPVEGNMDYYAKNDNDAGLLARMNDPDANEILKTVSIKKVLPIIDFQYGGLNGVSREIVIDQDPKCERYFCLMVTGTTGESEETEETVKKLIEGRGYNPEDYGIRYELR